MSWELIDSRLDGEDVITRVTFFGVPENKNRGVTLDVRHIKPSSIEEVYEGINEMELTTQPPNDREQDSRARDIVEELKAKG